MAKKTLSTAVIILATALLAWGDPISHVVQKGETLYGIAKKYGVTVDGIVALNGIKDPSKVLPGTTLTIPSASGSAAPAGTSTSAPAATVPAAPQRTLVPYVVQKGDTLYGISRKFGITVEELVALNALGSTTIKPGQTLKVPGTAAAATALKPPAVTPPATGSGTAAAVAKPVPSIKAESGTWPAAGGLSFLQGKLKGVAIDVKPGSAFNAIRAGTVVSAGPFRSFGNVVFVQSTDGLVYVYGGASALTVRVGDSIRKGAALGSAAADADGRAQVYFFAFKGAESLDPASVPRD